MGLAAHRTISDHHECTLKTPGLEEGLHVRYLRRVMLNVPKSPSK